MPFARRAVGVALVAIAFAPVAIAQTNAEINSGVQFSFVPPGARSLAMGGAFVGLADDATAAWTNPAGLLNLSRPEVSLEGRQASYTNQFTSGGTVDDAGTTNLESDLTGISFASFVRPAKSQKWSFAIFFHQLADFEAEQSSEAIAAAPSNPFFFLRGSTGFLTVEIPGVGVAGAVKLGERVSLGANLVAYSYDYDSEVANVLPDPTRKPDVLSTHGDDSSWGGGVGISWSGEKVRLGAVYRRGPEFDADFQFRCGTGAVGGGNPCTGHDNEIVPALSGSSAFRVPDSAALGAAFTPNSRLSLVLGVNWVFYSQMSDETKDVTGLGDPDAFSIDDSTQVHGGLEYAIPLAGERSLFLRAGGWNDPDHRMHYRVGSVTTGDLDRRFNIRFNTIDEDDFHVTGGLGMTFGTRLQIDVAADFSDFSDVVSLSTVYRF
jgi:long-subunit fatty acid transport protein